MLLSVLGLSVRGTLGTEPLALWLGSQPHTLEVEPLNGALDVCVCVCVCACVYV